VQSQSPGLTISVDLRLHLADRLGKLHGLASFIATNSKMSLLSQNALRKLSADAELLAAAIDIWEYQSNFPVKGVNDPLVSAIKATLETTSEASQEGDFVRYYFRDQLFTLTNALAQLPTTLEQAEGVEERTSWTIRVNQILLVSGISYTSQKEV
jgi:hypothetical protein